MNYIHATIAEIDTAIAGKKLTKTLATEILTERATHDSSSGRRAARWVAAHTSTKSTPEAKPAKPAKVTSVTGLPMAQQRAIDARAKALADEFAPEGGWRKYMLATRKDLVTEALAKGATTTLKLVTVPKGAKVSR